MSDYLASAVWTLLTFVVLAGGVNVVVDPGEQLLRAQIGGKWFERYAGKLDAAPFGLPYVGSGRERELKWVMDTAATDCNVIGSSRSSQLSSVRSGAIRSLCPDLVNLSVPGGSIEDLIVLAHRSLESGPPTLVLAIEPWFLSYRSGPGWWAWGERLGLARAAFGLAADARPPWLERDRALAAFSLPAFLESLSLLAEHRADLRALYRPPIPAALEPYDLRGGHERSATLPDGSRVYPRAVIADARRGRTQRGCHGEVPRPRPVGFDPRALAELDAIIVRLHEAGRRVVLMRAPFHPDVFSRFPDRVVAYLEPAEARLDALAARHGLQRFGSYRAEEVGCSPREFKDLSHPLPECLDRVDWQRPSASPLRATLR